MADKQEFPPLLPEGFHPKTLDELELLCVDGFDLSRTRQGIMEGLRRMAARLESGGVRGDLWVDGSFLTEKIDPEDVDIALRVSEAQVSNPGPGQGALINWLGSRDPAIVAQTKGDYSCDSFVFYELPVGHPHHPGFDIREYWINEFGKSRRNELKGIVVLLISGGCQ